MANSIEDLKALMNTKLGFARPNKFLVTLPSVGVGGGLLNGLIGAFSAMGGGASPRELNILCSNATMPAKQVLTNDRRIGMEFQKVAYGYAVDDVSMTFYLMNDYGIKDYFDSFQIKEIYNYNDKSFDINGIIDLTNSKVKVSRLNYNKDYGKKSEINFDVNFVLDKYYNINNLNFLADKTKIHLSNIKLNKNFEVKDFKKLEIKTFENEIKNNDFLAKKSEKVTISGEVFDAHPLLKSLYKKSDQKTFS